MDKSIQAETFQIPDIFNAPSACDRLLLDYLTEPKNRMEEILEEYGYTQSQRR